MILFFVIDYMDYGYVEQIDENICIFQENRGFSQFRHQSIDKVH